MRFLVSTICFLCFASCNLADRFEAIKEIKKDLSRTFNHESISANISWGTEEDADKISIVFLEFDMSAKKYDELQSIASEVRNRILEKEPEFKKMDLIEVAFTNEKDDENPGTVTSFRFRN